MKPLLLWACLGVAGILFGFHLTLTSSISDGGLIAGALATSLVVGSPEVISSGINAGASLIGTSVQALSSDGPNRNMVIEITNHMDKSIYGGHQFLQWGWTKVPPVPVIAKMTREAMQFQKVSDTATGTAGIVAYNLGTKADPARLAIIFSVPYNYIHASNWFGLKFISGSQPIDKKLYDEMYYDYAWKYPEAGTKYGYAYEGRPISVFYKDYVVSATMSNVGRSVIKVDIQKVAGGHEENNKLFHGWK